MLAITVTAVNAREIEMQLGGFAQDVSDLRPVWKGVSATLRNIVVNKQFGSEGQSGQHGKWAALSPRYAEWKARHYPGMPILQRTGHLLASFFDGGPDHVDRSSELRLEWGTKTPYAIYHQMGYSKTFGSGAGRRSARASTKSARASASAFEALSAVASAVTGRNVPARRMLDPNDDDINEIRRSIQRGIVQMIRRRGFKVAGEAYGPAERGEVGPGEAFVIGRTA